MLLDRDPRMLRAYLAGVPPFTKPAMSHPVAPSVGLTYRGVTPMLRLPAGTFA